MTDSKPAAAALDQLGVYAVVERDVRDKVDRLVIAAREADASWRELADALGLRARSGAEARYAAAVRRQQGEEEPS